MLQYSFIYDLNKYFHDYVVLEHVEKLGADNQVGMTDAYNPFALKSELPQRKQLKSYGNRLNEYEQRMG